MASVLNGEADQIRIQRKMAALMDGSYVEDYDAEYYEEYDE